VRRFLGMEVVGSGAAVVGPDKGATWAEPPLVTYCNLTLNHEVHQALVDHP
jgi:hypothetical protein